MYIADKTKYNKDYIIGQENISNEPSNTYRIVSMNNGKIEIKNEENGAFFSITDSNLMYLMDHSIVEDKTFKTKCVMVKEGPKTILLPEGSRLYDIVMERENRPNLRLNPGKVYIVKLRNNELKEMLYLGSFQDNYIYLPKKYRKIKSSGKIIFSRKPTRLRSAYKGFYFLSINNGKILKFQNRNAFTLIDKVYENFEGYETKELRFETVRNHCISSWEDQNNIVIPSTKDLYFVSSQKDIERFYKENNIEIK